MANYYIYFISSLPSLHFLAKPPFSSENFFMLCERFIPTGDIEMLKICSISAEYTNKNIHPTLKKWQEFDTALRNELVRVRAGYKHLDPAKYLRPSEVFAPSLGHIAMAAHRNPSILEAEKMLDQERWCALDELAIGHYFDLDFLIVYLLKLLLLERWAKISGADKSKIVEEALKT